MDKKINVSNLSQNNEIIVSPIKLPKSPISQTSDLRDKNSKITIEQCSKTSGIILSASVLITIYTAIIYGIIGMSHTSDGRIKHLCPNSNLWNYVLSWSVLVSIFLFVMSKTQAEQGLGLIICGIIFILIYIVWGSIEIWDIASDCDKIHPKSIFLSGYMILFINYIILLSIIISLILICCLYKFCTYDYNKNISQLSQNKKNSKFNSALNEDISSLDL